MKHTVDSRKRSTLIIVFIVLISFTLFSYIYSFSRTNNLLTRKYESLVTTFQSCQSLFDVCDSQRKVLSHTGIKLQEAERDATNALKTKKNELADMQITLATMKKESTEKQSRLDLQKMQLANLESVLEDTRSKLGVLNEQNVYILESLNITTSNTTSQLENKINEEIERLKMSHIDHLELKNVYATLMDNHSKLIHTTNAIKGELEILRNAGSPATATERQVEETSEKLASLDTPEKLTSVDEEQTVPVKQSSEDTTEPLTGDIENKEVFVESTEEPVYVAAIEMLSASMNTTKKPASADTTENQAPVNGTESQVAVAEKQSFMGTIERPVSSVQKQTFATEDQTYAATTGNGTVKNETSVNATENEASSYV